MLTWYAWLLIGIATGTVLSNLAFWSGFRDRDDKVMRRRERWARRQKGYLFWWLLPPGWRYRR
jgi:hypothetical protein